MQSYLLAEYPTQPPSQPSLSFHEDPALTPSTLVRICLLFDLKHLVRYLKFSSLFPHVRSTLDGTRCYYEGGVSDHPQTSERKCAMFTRFPRISIIQGCSSMRQGDARRAGSFSRL